MSISRKNLQYAGLIVIAVVLIGGGIVGATKLINNKSAPAKKDTTLASSANYTLTHSGGIVPNDAASKAADAQKNSAASTPQNTAKKPAAAPVAAAQPSSAGKVLFSDAFSGPDRILTNEFVYWSKTYCPYRSSVWEMTSGTAFIKNNAGYSGIPTLENHAECESATATNSSIFRLNTKQSNFANSNIALDFMMQKHGGGGAPVNSYDGVHIWSRYQSQYALYIATISRWDGTIVIKKKVPVNVAGCSDPANDGCYYNLTNTVNRPDLGAGGKWHHAEVVTIDDAAGHPHIALFIDGAKVVEGTDNDLHGPSYHSGATGIRGDNTEFYFRNFVVTQQ